jgi:hypothetical protein
LPTLVTRYQHAWNHAALDALRTTAGATLTSDQASRLLADPGAGQLARVLADAASRGANPGQVLTAAIDYDTLTGARSTALVLAAASRTTPPPSVSQVARRLTVPFPGSPPRTPDTPIGTTT